MVRASWRVGDGSSFVPMLFIEVYGPLGFPSFWGHTLRTIRLEAIALRFEAMALRSRPSLLGWRPSLLGWRVSVLNYRRRRPTVSAYLIK